jgi:hypothetical protein
VIYVIAPSFWGLINLPLHSVKYKDQPCQFLLVLADPSLIKVLPLCCWNRQAIPIHQEEGSSDSSVLPLVSSAWIVSD